MDRVINDIYLTNIGDALRDTLGEENQFPPEDMGDAVKVSNEVAFSDGYCNGFEEGEEFGYNTGFVDGDELGYQAGMEQGYNNGKTDGIEEGKQAQNYEFWLNVTNNQARTSYYRGFNYWANEYIRPPFKIVPTARQGHHYIVQDCRNLLKVEKAYFDFSQISDLSQTNNQNGNLSVFSGCSKLIEIEDVGLPAAAYSNTFYDCVKLEKIAVVRAQEDTTFNSNTFGYCSRLRDLTIEGVIGTDISFNRSPLSIESLKSVITHLKDFGGGNEYSQTVTFKTSAFEVLEAEGATAEYNGVACTWAELIDNKKWNLTLA